MARICCKYSYLCPIQKSLLQALVIIYIVLSVRLAKNDLLHIFSFWLVSFAQESLSQLLVRFSSLISPQCHSYNLLYKNNIYTITYFRMCVRKRHTLGIYV